MINIVYGRVKDFKTWGQNNCAHLQGAGLGLEAHFDLGLKISRLPLQCLEVGLGQKFNKGMAGYFHKTVCVLLGTDHAEKAVMGRKHLIKFCRNPANFISFIQ